MDNPYQSPLTDAVGLPVDEPLREYGGIGRLAYVGYSFLAGIVVNVLGMVAGAIGAGNELLGPAVFAIGLIAAVGLTIFITVQRLKNMGYSGWWSVLIFVPLANLLVGLRCLICPAGYADTGRLDRAGKILTWIVVAFFLLTVLGILASMYAAAR
jgi:uncharacterized membrane protein YhaH (DUF805 family)